MIKQISYLKDLPVFPDFSAPTDLPQFRKHNLIYGFNGCGKTTIARVLASLGSGVSHSGLPNEGTFEITLTDGTSIHTNTVDQSLSDRILVLSTDFVADNFRWTQGEAEPIYYLGQEQKNLFEELAAETVKVEQVGVRLRRVSTLQRQFAQRFSQHKTDRARLVASELGLGRLYVSTQLEADYGEYTHSKDHLLDEVGLKVQRDILRQDEPLPKLARLNNQIQDMDELMRDVRSVLETTLGTISIEALHDHGEMLPWIKEGLEYHKTNGLEDCLLCGNPLSAERIEALEAAIDERYDQLISDIAGAMTTAETLRDTLAEVKPELQSKNDIVKDQQAAYTTAVSELQSVMRDGKQYADRAIDRLSKKQESPNAKVAPGAMPDESCSNQWGVDFIDKINALNAVIDAHNKSHDEFETVRDIAGEKLKQHYLADGDAEYRTLDLGLSKANRVKDKLQARSDQLATRVDDLKQGMRKHRPAAKRINAMIHRYLGHRELELAPKKEGYEIRRKGKVATAPPSEGEKTAITLCYFMVLLEADGRKREELIVVLDDPISSLDTRSLNYACSLIRSLEDVGQLIVLTHNVNVMNEIKKWLKPRTEQRTSEAQGNSGAATATLLYIDTIQPNGTETRESRLVEFPKHLRDYESEYQYLFHLVLRFLHSEEDRGNYFFVMPNVVRKVLEVFLAFRLPGPDGLSSKISNLAGRADEIGIDECRLRALGRLAHVESHGDNLDDLVTLSSMTIEETKNAVDTLLELMEKLDPDHKKRMCRICRVSA
ncbi:MAG: AAA family ATPase [Planctomycetes bacterium]|nr:AAA family ATPase [Planctomycetota bacterium]